MREQIRARVDSAEWEALRQDAEESNTALLARILQEWKEQKIVLASLTEIDVSPCQALGRLLWSYELLQQATVSIQQSEPLAAPSFPVDVDVVPSPIVGGLENNSGDW